MTDPMTAERALEWLKDLCVQARGYMKPEAEAQLDAALAYFDAHPNVYASRWKYGDEYFAIAKTEGWQLIARELVREISITERGAFVRFSYADIYYPEADCFPTRAEAQAECDRRNQK